MKKMIYVVIAVVLLFVASRLFQQQPAKGVSRISAKEAYEMMKAETDYVVVDVRTLEEFQEGHIEDAILIPLDSIGSEKPKQLSNLNQKILVYCRSGNRSAQAANRLAKLGYTQIYDFGGINQWPYEIVK